MEDRIYSLVALLPIKAHSERINSKNFRMFHGKPLFRWMLDTLAEMSEIDLIVINTDARELLLSHGLSESDRIRIRDRKPELCGDSVSMNRIIADDLQSTPASVYLMTHATNPLLRGDTIRTALNAFTAKVATGEADSLFGVTRYHSRFYWSNGAAINHDPSNLVRTQDLPPVFEENSNIYIFTKRSFESTKARIGVNPYLFETPRLESIDIDDYEGWVLAEALAAVQADATRCRAK